MQTQRPSNKALHAKLVKKEWDEGREADGGDGYWMLLNDGYNLDGASAIHEDTRAKCMNRLSEVVEGEPY